MQVKSRLLMHHNGLNSLNMGVTTQQIARISFLVLCLMGILQGNVYAKDSLAAVIARMKTDTAVRIKYQEIRHLELMADPWHGSGYMYAMTPDIMVKEQLHPVREVMGAAGDEMYYYNPPEETRYHTKMDENDSLSLQVGALQALLNGDRQLLNEMYQIEFIVKKNKWVLLLKSKSAADGKSLSRLLITGLPGAAANKITVFQTDGDNSEYILEKDAEGEEIKVIVKQLYKEIKGDE
jgi:outer membrane lipoprotein carrier protein LolA